MVYLSATIYFMLTALGTNASRLKGTFRHAYGLPKDEMNKLTLANFSDSSDIGCGRRCSRYPGCTSFSLAPGLCMLMTARRNVRHEQGGMDFYVNYEVESSCFQETGTNGGKPFNLSSAYYASYHPISKVRLFYDSNKNYFRGLEVKHGSDIAHTGKMIGFVEECQLGNNEFIQRLEYSIYQWPSDGGTAIPVFGCIALITTHKTCGPYGNLCGSMIIVEGHHLLYIKGRHGIGFDKLSLAFEFC